MRHEDKLWRHENLHVWVETIRCVRLNVLAEVYKTTQTGDDDEDEDVLNVSENEAVIRFMLQMTGDELLA